MSVKCPPQCSSKCNSKHHPLLLALLNWPEGDGHSSRLDQARVEFTALVHKYEQSGSWSKEKDIPEDTELYKFPLLHWAAVLGKFSAVKSLLDIGVSSGLQSRQSKESALHRAINCLQQTRSKDAIKVMQKLVPMLDVTLTVRDLKGNTPLHLSCIHLDNEKAKVEFFAEVISSLTSYVKRKGTASKVLNMKNIEGNTVLHILCRHDRNIPSIRNVVEAGAETDVCNNEGLKPLDIAIDCGQLKISQYLESLPQLSKPTKGRASASPHAPATKRRKMEGPQKGADSDSDGSSDRGKPSRGRKTKNPSTSSSPNGSGTTNKRNSQPTKNSPSPIDRTSSTDSEKVNGDKPQVRDKNVQADSPTRAPSVTATPSTPTSSTTATASTVKTSPAPSLASPSSAAAAVNGLLASKDGNKKTDEAGGSVGESTSGMSTRSSLGGPDSPPAGWSVLLSYLSNFEGTAKKAIMDALVEDEKDCVHTVKSKEKELTDFSGEMEKRESERKAKEQLLIQRLNEIMTIQNEVKQMEIRSSQDQQALKSLQTALSNLKEKKESCVAALQATNSIFSSQLSSP